MRTPNPPPTTSTGRRAGVTRHPRNAKKARKGSAQTPRNNRSLPSEKRQPMNAVNEEQYGWRRLQGLPFKTGNECRRLAAITAACTDDLTNLTKQGSAEAAILVATRVKAAAFRSLTATRWQTSRGRTSKKKGNLLESQGSTRPGDDKGTAS